MTDSAGAVVAEIPQVIHLYDDDDIVSIRDRLDWAQNRRVAFVLPDEGDLLTEALDLAILRRHADSLRQQVGLVTTDGRVTSQAKAVGIPTFRTIDDSLSNERRWRKGWRERVHAGRPTALSIADWAEVNRRRKERPRWKVWALRYAAVLVYLLTLVAVLVALAYLVPGATVTLRPEVVPLRVSRQIVADPQLERVNFGGASVPGRVLTTIEEWQAEVATTGAIEVADSPARGSVVFVNRLDQPVSVPAGSRVSTSAGSRTVFQTVEDVEVPGRRGGTVRADVVAIEPGTDGNVGAGLINRVEGALALQLNVRNPQPTEGGSARTEQAVTEADQQRLRAQVLQQLQALALSEMERALGADEFLAKDSLRIIEIVHETYSHFPGEQSDRLALDLRAELQATAVDETQAVGLVYDEMSRSIRQGFELVPESLDFRAGEVLAVDGEGRVTFEMIGEGLMAAALNLNENLSRVAGQETGVAMAYLYEHLPLQDYPTVNVWPNWFGRMPYLPVRIRAELITG